MLNFDFLFQDVVISCCDWLLEFFGVDILVIRVIKGVVFVGYDLRLKDVLDIERYSVYVYVWFRSELIFLCF